MLGDTLVTILFSALALRIVYRRFRRNVGRQQLSRTKLTIRILIYGILSALVTTLTFTSNPVALAAAAVGLALAWYSVRLTRFEHEPEGAYYTPNTLIGVAVFSLFLGRLAYRLVWLTRLDPAAFTNRFQGERGSPLTLAILLLLVSYYAFYYGGLMLHSLIRQRRGLNLP